MIAEKIKKKIEELRVQIIDTLCDLTAIPTQNPPGQSYRECVDFLSGKLKEWDIDHRIIPVPDGRYPRFSILGHHGEGRDSLHFHAHYDVVPADSSEQFKPLIKGDRLYGRGSSDMKSGLIAMLFALRIIKEFDIEFDGKITFSLVPDEETGGVKGTRFLIESGNLPKVSLGSLMPEPTSGVIWNSNRGALTYRVNILGKSAHVALEHQGENAFDHMVEVVQSLLRLKKTIQKRKTRLAVHPPEGNRSVMLIGGECGSGINFNVVPEKAFFTIDRRINPEENHEEVKKELIEVFQEGKRQGVEIKVELLQEGESSQASTATPLASALKQAISDIEGKTPVFRLCPGLCEIRFFNNMGIPAYAYGPGLLQVSHGPDEYVSISSVLNCASVYALTAIRSLSQ